MAAALSPGEIDLYPNINFWTLLMPYSKVILSCGVHECPLKCHRIADHSKSQCKVVVERVCERQHQVKVECSNKDKRCRECFREDQDHERRLKRDIELESKRLARQVAYRMELEQIEDEIDYHRRQMQYMKEEDDEEKEITQKRRDAKDLSIRATRMREAKIKDDKKVDSVAKGQRKMTNESKPRGAAEEDWQWLKKHTGADSQALDDLMEMIGLEAVKQELLSVKTKVDTILKQNSSLASERFNCTMLGNPGTGTFTAYRKALLISR